MTVIQDMNTADKDLSACARVLVAVLDQKRVLRMKPKPKDVDVTKQPPRRRAASADATPFVEAPGTSN